MSGQRNDKAVSADKQKYIDEWSRMMINIWQDRIDRYGVYNTGALRTHISETVTANGNVDVVLHRFWLYGIYQDMGVGNGYTRGNGGQLHFMDPSSKHYGDRHRKERPWFSKAYYSSVMVLKEAMGRIYGDGFAGIIADALEGR